MIVLSDLQIDNIARVFTVLDHDGNGRIEWADFELVTTGMARECGRDPESPQVKALLGCYREMWDYLREFADADRDDSVTSAEFRSAYERSEVFATELRNHWARVADAVFTMADVDVDGQLTTDDLLDLYLGAEIPQQIAVPGIRSMTREEGGHIDRAAFRDTVCGVFTATRESEPGGSVLKGL
ncbi:EF-hand domain-containing protein [Pseudonocardiaceae bacterium YIM PH 21723]|nr:EF-hand domain-containing protein [Pseudonocardiaceae bacterium YIM PH 21723]